MSLLEENIEKILQFQCGQNFLPMTTKAKVGKQDHFELKGFCTPKETMNGVKRQPTEENISGSFSEQSNYSK